MATRSTRNTKFTADPKATIVEDAKLDETHSAFSEMFAEALNVKYPWLGTIVNLTTFALGAYTGVQVAMWLGLAVTIFTTSTFLGGLITFIAALIAIVQSLRAGAVAGRYVSTGQFENDYQSAKSTVLGWFKREPKEA